MSGEYLNIFEAVDKTKVRSKRTSCFLVKYFVFNYIILDNFCGFFICNKYGVSLCMHTRAPDDVIYRVFIQSVYCKDNIFIAVPVQ